MRVVNFYLTLPNLSHNYLICRVIKQPVLSLLFDSSARGLLAHEPSRCPGASCLSLLLVALHTCDGLEHVWESLLVWGGPHPGAEFSLTALSSKLAGLHPRWWFSVHLLPPRLYQLYFMVLFLKSH